MERSSKKGATNSWWCGIPSIAGFMTFSSTTPFSNNSQPSPFPWQEELKIRCWTALARGALWLLGKTTRKQHLGGEELLAHWRRGEQTILAFWHNRILLML